MTQEFWNEFIQIFKESPCLWDKKCADYKNTLKKNIAYGLLEEKLWDINDTADVNIVIEKLASLRNDYDKEKKRIARNKRLGKNIEPTWEYYESLQFLDSDYEESANPESTVEDSTLVNATLSSAIPASDTRSSSSTKIRTDSNLPPTDQSSTKLLQQAKPGPSLLNASERQTDRKDSISTNDGVKSPTLKRRRTFDKDLEDDSSTFAAHLKTRMRMFDPMQKCIAQKLISDIMFLAETKQLQMTTSIVNHKPS